MGGCPCFGFLRRGKKARNRSDNIKKEPSSRVEPRRESVSVVKGNLRSESSAPKAGPGDSSKPPLFTYKELASATNNFSDESFVGRGGFGAVYKGKLDRTGQLVAVKRLDPSGFQGDKEFLVEVLMLSLVHHPNLVNLMGYCAEGDQRLLVYEYMPLGSLEDHLFDPTPDMKPLDWNTRMKIAHGTAKGLDGLHNANPPVIYRDLKASNILLDSGFHPKLSDFGLAKFAPSGDQSHVSTRVMGTYGYCAPEYASTGRLTFKTDIYSYGIVLLELITGRRAVGEIDGHQKHLTSWAIPLMKDRDNHALLADPLLNGQYSVSVMKKAIEVASVCLSENASLRPSSSDLVLAMDYLVSRKNEPKGTKKVKWEELDFSPSEAAMMVDKERDRDRAVAEAKLWGESWREKRQQAPQTTPEGKGSWVNKIQSGL